MTYIVATLLGLVTIVTVLIFAPIYLLFKVLRFIVELLTMDYENS